VRTPQKDEQTQELEETLAETRVVWDMIVIGEVRTRGMLYYLIKWPPVIPIQGT